jgi:hypothetical protein
MERPKHNRARHDAMGLPWYDELMAGAESPAFVESGNELVGVVPDSGASHGGSVVRTRGATFLDVEVVPDETACHEGPGGSE